VTWSFINGWNNSVNRANRAVYLLGLLLCSVQAAAEESQAEQPSMELLEFLGEAAQVDGRWLEPLNMIEIQDIERQGEQAEGQTNE